MKKCEDCKEREGIIEFCESVTDYTHGFKQYICRQCYVKRIEVALKNTQDNLDKQKKLLAEESDSEAIPSTFFKKKEKKNGKYILFKSEVPFLWTRRR